jgi:PKD repeat protein
MRSIGVLAAVVGTLVLGWACSGEDVGTPPPDNTAPVADFAMPPCVIAEPCQFASTSTDDVEVTEWSWNFDGDDTADANTATASFTYNTAGTFNVSLTVHDAQGLSNTKVGAITIAPAPPVNTPPTASFDEHCDALACSFTSTSTDAAPGTIATYGWTFGDGGTADVSNPSHTYTAAAPTEFTVTLTVTDNEGATGVATHKITVAPVVPGNTPPTASFMNACNAADCTFVSTSTDVAPGRIVAYSWTFGDGATANVSNPAHSYVVAGPVDFTVTLTVRDNQGATATATKTISVTPLISGNVPPTAAFTPWCYGEGCIFLSKSTDVAPGKIVRYDWTFGDGTTESSDWNAPSHVYSITTRTTFTVTLTVTDNEGATAVASQRFSLIPLPPAVQGCTTSGKIVDCVLDIPTTSTLKLKLLGVSCDLSTNPASRITTPPPVGDQVFLTVCRRSAGEEIGIFGGRLDELIVYQAGSQARIWFSQGNAADRPLNPPVGQLTGNWPDWTINYEDGDHVGAPGEPDFTDVVLGVHATVRP